MKKNKIIYYIGIVNNLLVLTSFSMLYYALNYLDLNNPEQYHFKSILGIIVFLIIINLFVNYYYFKEKSLFRVIPFMVILSIFTIIHYIGIYEDITQGITTVNLYLIDNLVAIFSILYAFSIISVKKEYKLRKYGVVILILFLLQEIMFRFSFYDSLVLVIISYLILFIDCVFFTYLYYSEINNTRNTPNSF